MNSSDIFLRYPFLSPHSSTTFLVIGDDLDSYLSAMLFIKHHPNTRIIGFYEQYRTLYLHPDHRSFLPATVWIDLDIFHPECHSLGHHILRLSKNDALTGFTNSCNMNELREINIQSFQRKYPLGTIHFLLALYEESYAPDTTAELLYWLADSSYINGQSHRFRNNVKEWLDNFLIRRQLSATFETIDGIDFEKRMALLYEELRSAGFVQGSGQVTSRHLQLGGFQLQTTFARFDHFSKICEFLSKKTALPNLTEFMEKETITKVFSGRRTSIERDDLLKKGTLDLFLSEEKVFSYVFPSRRTINYTTDIIL